MQFSAGGLRFGYAALTDASLAEEVKEVATAVRPHGSLRYAVKKLLAATNAVGGTDDGANGFAPSIYTVDSVRKDDIDSWYVNV